MSLAEAVQQLGRELATREVTAEQRREYEQIRAVLLDASRCEHDGEVEAA